MTGVWCAQQCQPGDAIRRMQQRSGERQQILDHRDFRQRLDVDAVIADARLAQTRKNGLQMRACAHQQRDARIRVFGARRRNQLGHAPRFLRARVFTVGGSRLAAFEQRVHANDAARMRLDACGGRAVADRAGDGIVDG
jgi:hypothetical protein